MNTLGLIKNFFDSLLARKTPTSVDALLAAVLPPRCGVCDTPQGEHPRYGVCARCFERVVANDEGLCEICDVPSVTPVCVNCRASSPPFATLTAPYLYGGTIAELIGRVKFRQREDLAVGLGRLIADHERVRHAVVGAEVIVPVPLGRRRRRQRGFNQSAVLARVLGREFGLQVVYALTRTRETRPQSQMSSSERVRNVANAFAPRRFVHGRCILVDDVVTSGQTVREAAKTLLTAGAREVIVVAAARTVRTGS